MAQEIWKPVKGYEGLYEVSNTGKVYSHRREKMMTPNITEKGYYSVTLRKNGIQRKCRVHRLVAEAFLNNHNNLPDVNHIDGNKQNNCVDNLEWCSHSDNLLHAYETGLEKVVKGEKHHRAKLTQEQADYIRRVYKRHDPVYGGFALAKRFNVHVDTVMNVLKGVCYGG